jgi:hypothetical protein
MGRRWEHKARSLLVIQVISELTPTKSSDFKSRIILTVLRAKNLKFDEKSKVQKVVMLASYN